MKPLDDGVDRKSTGARGPRRAASRVAAALVMAGSLLALASCAGAGPTYAALERDARSVDRLPDALPTSARDRVDPASARFAGEHDGTSLWIVRGAGLSEVCLLDYEGDSGWALSCGSESGPPRIGREGRAFQIFPDDVIGLDETMKISDNVYLAGADGAS